MTIVSLPQTTDPSVVVGGKIYNVDPVYNLAGASGVGASLGTVTSYPSAAPASNPTNASPNPPYLNFQFDSIGQPIPRTLGHVRLALKPIWVKGLIGSDTSSSIVINAIVYLASGATAGDTSINVTFVPTGFQAQLDAGGLLFVVNGTYTGTVTGIYDTVITLDTPLPNDLAAGAAFQAYTPNAEAAAPTITVALALCQPLDPQELGNITAFYDGAAKTYSLDEGGLILPPSWTVAEQAQLTASLNGAVVFPGTEGQLPSPLIVAERGAAKTPAFRGLRYIILQDYPLVGGLNGGSLTLSIIWRRTNVITRLPQPPRSNKNITAVQFAAGSS